MKRSVGCIKFFKEVSMMKMKLMLMVVALAVFAVPAQGGYRLVFITSTNPGAEMSTIEEYNAYVQALADVAGIGYDYNVGDMTGLKWSVIGSTSLVDARDNTGTNPLVDGVGVSILLLDGTVVADDNADLWDGDVDNTISMDEYGNAKDHWPFTGTGPDGTQATANYGPLGQVGGNVAQGQSSVTTNWIHRAWTGDPPETHLPLYAMSEIIPEPATIALLGLGSLALLRRRRA
jgi:hypothetical protein